MLTSLFQYALFLYIQIVGFFLPKSSYSFHFYLLKEQGHKPEYNSLLECTRWSVMFELLQ